MVLAALLLVAAQPLHAPLRLTKPVQDKNFYELSLLERNGAALNDKALGTLRDAKLLALHHAVSTCALDAGCFAQAMRFSDEDIRVARQALRGVPLDDDALRASGTEILHPTVEAAWLDAANGINNIIDVYGS